jgi:hypothetical protein
VQQRKQRSRRHRTQPKTPLPRRRLCHAARHHRAHRKGQQNTRANLQLKQPHEPPAQRPRRNFGKVKRAANNKAANAHSRHKPQPGHSRPRQRNRRSQRE